MKILFLVLFIISIQSCKKIGSRSFEIPKGSSISDYSLSGFNFLHNDFFAVMKEKNLQLKQFLLDRYIFKIQKVLFKNFSKWPKVHRKVFLLNTFNAFLLKVILETESENLNATLFNRKKSLLIFKKYYSFSAFKDKEIIAKYPTAKTVLSLHCFDKDCPVFQELAYNYKNISMELDKSIKRYFIGFSSMIFNKKSKALVIPNYIETYLRFFPKTKNKWQIFLQNIFKDGSTEDLLIKNSNFKILEIDS